MKNILSVLFAAGAVLAIGCHSNQADTPTPAATIDSTVVQTPLEEAPKAEGGTEEKATAELCNCMNDALRGLNPKIRAIILRAGKSENPELTLQKELISISNTEEAQQIAQEFQQFQENNKVEKCSEDIKRKYSLDEKDKASRDKLMKAAAENQNCELVYALMKISVQQTEKGPGEGIGQ